MTLMITFFTTAKPFTGHNGVIQRNALKSWKLAAPKAEVILFGDEEGAVEAAQELGIRHVADVGRVREGVFNNPGVCKYKPWTQRDPVVLRCGAANCNSWFVLMPCRADALLLGVLAAITFESREAVGWIKRHRTLCQWCIGALGVGSAILGKVSHGMQDKAMLSVGYTWIAPLYVSLLVYGISWQDSYLSSLLSLPVLRWLGSIAYGTYILHEIVLGAVFGAFKGEPPKIMTVSDVFVTFLALIAIWGFAGFRGRDLRSHS
jgi:hypothetical protein